MIKVKPKKLIFILLLVPILTSVSFFYAKKIQASTSGLLLDLDQSMYSGDSMSDEEFYSQIAEMRQSGDILPEIESLNNSNNPASNSSLETATVDGLYNSETIEVPYFNQCWEKNGSYYPDNIINGNWKACDTMCGAAAAVMAAGYHRVLPYTGRDGWQYKRFMYDPTADSRFSSLCYTYGVPQYPNTSGAFSITGKNVGCHQSDTRYIKEYLQLVGLETHDSTLTMDSIVRAISERGNPLLVNIGWATGGGHFIIIKGFDIANNKIIVSDSHPKYNGNGFVFDFTNPTEYRQRGLNTAFKFRAIFEINRKDDMDKLDYHIYESSFTIRGSKSFQTTAVAPFNQVAGYGSISWKFNDSINTRENKNYSVAYYKSNGVWFGEKSISVVRHKYGDINNDGNIGNDDLALIMKNWGRIDPNDYMVNLNYNQDKIIDIIDLSILAGQWGK